jgi:hypothetical protein
MTGAVGVTCPERVPSATVGDRLRPYGGRTLRLRPVTFVRCR